MKNVYNIIDESPFYLDRKGLRFYFSSELNRTRFNNQYKNYLVEENTKLNNRYLFSVDLSIPLLLSLYLKIEKRGFKVLRIDDNFKLNKDIKFSTIIL